MTTAPQGAECPVPPPPARTPATYRPDLALDLLQNRAVPVDAGGNSTLYAARVTLGVPIVGVGGALPSIRTVADRIRRDPHCRPARLPSPQAKAADGWDVGGCLSAL